MAAGHHLEDLQRVYASLAGEGRVPQLADRQRAVEAVRETREAAGRLGLGAADAAGCAVLRLAAQISKGSTVVRAEREQLAQCIGLLLLDGTVEGRQLLREARWSCDLCRVPIARLEVTYRQFRGWFDAVDAEHRAAGSAGRTRGLRVGLAVVSADALGAADPGDSRIARLVNERRRSQPVNPEDVSGSLLLAQEQGASVEGLLRRTPSGLRWADWRARDLVESVTPKAEPTRSRDEGGGPAGPESDVPGAVTCIDAWDRLIASLDARERAIIEGRRVGQTDAEIGRGLGMTESGVQKARKRLEEHVRRYLG